MVRKKSSSKVATEHNTANDVTEHVNSAAAADIQSIAADVGISAEQLTEITSSIPPGREKDFARYLDTVSNLLQDCGAYLDRFLRSLSNTTAETPLEKKFLALVSEQAMQIRELNKELVKKTTSHQFVWPGVWVSAAKN